MKVTIKTLTPVHIGNSDFLSPYGDYIYQDGYVYYLNYSKLEKYLFDLKESSKLIDGFVEIVKKQADGNSSSRYKLIDFFKNNNLDFMNFVALKVTCNENVRSEEIQRMILTSNRPFIPGSSIKGAIRTTLLYNYLLDNNYYLHNMRKGYIGEDVFGKYDQDILKYLYVSDTNPLLPKNRIIVKTYRYNLDKKKKTIPILKEAIPEKTRLNLKLQGKAQNNNQQQFNYLNTDREDEILKKINKFTSDLIDQEIMELKNHNNGDLDTVVELYERLHHLTEKYKQGEGAVLRLGSGKTYFDNTISRLLDEKDLQAIRNKANLGKYKPFPTTRTVIVENKKIRGALGWVVIEKE